MVDWVASRIASSDARLRELAQDYFAAFSRNPTKENLCRAQLLAAISYSPDRTRALAGDERQLTAKEQGAHKTFWHWTWVRLVLSLVATHDGEPEAVARDLIRHMPVTLRAECRLTQRTRPSSKKRWPRW